MYTLTFLMAPASSMPCSMRFDLAGALLLELVEAAVVAVDDLADLLLHRRVVHLDGTRDGGHAAEEGLGDLAVGRDDGFAGLASSSTSSGIFSPRRMFERDSVISSRRRKSAVRYSSLTFLTGAALVVGREAGSMRPCRPRRDLHVHDDAGDAGGHAEGGVLHVAAFSPKIARSSFSSGARSVFGLRGDLADEDVAGLHLGADADDAVAVEVAQGFLADVRDVAGDLLGPELRVAGGDFEFLDVDGGEDVVLRACVRMSRMASSKL
jgi:hypothetical protein